MDRAIALEIEEAIWDRLHFATHLRSERLGEYTIGSDLHRSEPLALVQLLILYHLVTAKAAVALGGESPRTEAENGKRQQAAEAEAAEADAGDTEDESADAAAEPVTVES